MPKKETATPLTPGQRDTSTPIAVKDWPAALRQRFAGIKRHALDVSAKFFDATTRMRDRAEEIITFWKDLDAVYRKMGRPRGLPFIDFVRIVDPTTPLASKDYNNHRTFYTLSRMKRITEQGDRASRIGGAAAGGAANNGGLRSAGNVFTARLLKTIQSINGADPARILDDAVKEGQLTKNVATRLRQRIADARPLFQITVSKPAVIELVHDDRPLADQAKPTPGAAAAEGEEAEPMAQGGKQVRVKALAGKLRASMARSHAAAAPRAKSA